MNWVDHVMWWHVYPLGALGAPIRDAEVDGDESSPLDAGGPAAADAGATVRDPSTGARVVHRLPRLVPWLDHLLGLGLNGLALGPVAASQTHGYDSTDLLRLDPRLGDDADWDALVAACRERGVRILLDGVFNHVGAAHPWFVRALAEGPDGELAGLFRIDWDAPGGPRAADFEGHSSLVALRHEDPRVVAHVVDVICHWLDRGADGWRLDAAYAVDPAFWARVLPQVRESHPEAWVVGEVIHGDYPGVVAASGMDSVTQYELWKAVWSALADRNLFELDHALARHARFLDAFVPLTFVGNHDVTRIATRVGARPAVLALAVLMTVGGVPAIYYGDEIGATAPKEDRLGGDDAVRPPLDDAPSAPTGDAAVVLRAHRALIALRRRHPWLVTARTERRELSNTRCVYVAREHGGDGVLVVELDVTADPTAVISGADGEVLFATEP